MQCSILTHTRARARYCMIAIVSLMMTLPFIVGKKVVLENRKYWAYVARYILQKQYGSNGRVCLPCQHEFAEANTAIWSTMTLTLLN